MEENFVFLTAVSDYEVNIICQRLKGAGIEYSVRDSTANAWQRLYGGVSLIGKEVLVKAADLTRAKELLGIKDDKPSSSGKTGKQSPKIIDIILFPFAILAVIFAGISIINNFLFTPELFQKFAKLFPIIFSKKLFVILSLIVIILAGGIFAWQQFGTPKSVACTEEARICPDGSAVGRIGPNCEFAQCPAAKPDETADWQTYKNEEYGFEFKYPKDWTFQEKIPQPQNFGIKTEFQDVEGNYVLSISNPIPEIGFISFEIKDKKQISIKNSAKFFEETIYYFSENGSYLISIQWNRDDWKNSGQISFSYQKESDPNLNVLDEMLSTFKFLE